MNKNFLEHYMKAKPDTNEQKYLFLVDNIDLAFALISAGYPAVTLLYGQQGYHDINTFIDYMPVQIFQVQPWKVWILSKRQL